MAIVSREGAATYRVRGYLARAVDRGRTTIAWVWDVYDARQARALRITGEEVGGRPAAIRGASPTTDAAAGSRRAASSRSSLASPAPGAELRRAPRSR